VPFVASMHSIEISSENGCPFSLGDSRANLPSTVAIGKSIALLFVIVNW